MKFSKKLGALAVTAILAMSIVGCSSNQSSGGENGGSGQEAQAMTPEERIKAANAAMKDAKSMDMSMIMDMSMSMGEEGVSANTTMDMTYFTDPMKMKIDMIANSNGQESAMYMYVEETDGKYMMYSSLDGTTWGSAEIPADQVSEIDMSQSMEMYLEESLTYTEEGTEQIDGKDVVKLVANLSGDDLKAALESSGALDSFTSLGLDPSSMADVYNDLGELPVVVYLDSATNLPVKVEMDMTGVFSKLMTNIFAAIPDGAAMAEMLKIDALKMTMTAANIGSAADFEIPAEAKA